LPWAATCRPGGFTADDTDPPGAKRLQSSRSAPRSGALMSPVPGRAIGQPVAQVSLRAGILRPVAKVPGGGSPRGRGLGGGAKDANPAAGAFDHRENVHAGPGQRDGLDEVAGQQGMGWGSVGSRPRCRLRRSGNCGRHCCEASTGWPGCATSGGPPQAPSTALLSLTSCTTGTSFPPARLSRRSRRRSSAP
jgi:hypothetical protein